MRSDQVKCEKTIHSSILWYERGKLVRKVFTNRVEAFGGEVRFQLVFERGQSGGVFDVVGKLVI